MHDNEPAPTWMAAIALGIGAWAVLLVCIDFITGVK